MAFVIMTVFLSSCQKEKDEIIQETLTSANIETEQKDLFLMPFGFDELSEELQIEYFESLTTEDFEKLAENHRIGAYLESIDQLENVTNNLMSNGLLFTDVDLSKVLTDTQLNEMSTYNYDEIQSRGVCGWWSFHTSYYHPTNCWGPNCCTWIVHKRKCVGWFNTYTEYWHVNACL